VLLVPASTCPAGCDDIANGSQRGEHSGGGIFLVQFWFFRVPMGMSGRVFAGVALIGVIIRVFIRLVVISVVAVTRGDGACARAGFRRGLDRG
jgi:hypothetical protein